MNAPSFDIVVPTVGRPSLETLLRALRGGRGPRPDRLVVVDDRSHVPRSARLPVGVDLPFPVVVQRSDGRGPAAARNRGWRAGRAEWVVFLDDDVVPGRDWLAQLADDLVHAPPGAGGSQGRLHVPLPTDRLPTDWERNVAALESSAWITADIAYRRAVLEAVGGFDERFPRAYREDTDLALQVLALGSSIVRGRRCTEHPVPRADWSVSVHKQAGNADDALLRHRYGRDWRRRACAPRGRFPAHALAVALATSAVLGALARRPRVAVAAALGWAAATVEFAWSRSCRAARSPLHVATMLLTSAAIPFAAVFHRLRGEGRVLIDARRGLAPTTRLQRRVPVRAVLLDRDGTLVHDVPYNGNPALVDPVPGAPVALERLRTAGLRLAVVTNQSGIARGTVTADDVAAVNARVDALLGPIEHWAVCPHGPDDGCACRKPAAGLVLEAAARLGVAPQECVVIGDTGADVDAALAAGARAILVPNTATRAEEVALAPRVAPDLAAAVDLVVGS